MLNIQMVLKHRKKKLEAEGHTIIQKGRKIYDTM